jgi:GT2 family glycosyltransferase
MSEPLVTVVMVNLNCGRFVDRVFPTILGQTHSHLEALVIDNGSTDGSCEAIEARYPSAQIVRLGMNTGFSHALNEGIRLARGAFVLSLNFDVTLEPNFVAALVGALERDPRAGWAAGSLGKLAPDGAPLDGIDCNGHYLLPSRYCYGYDPAHPEPSFYSSERRVFGASACAALYRRAMLEDVAINGEIFDEDFFAYFEDVDLDWRAQQRGYHCVFTPHARGAHMRGGTGLSLRPEVAALLISNRFLTMIKNDDLRDVVRDLGPIVRRTAHDVLMHLRRHPRSIVIAASRVVRLAPRMLRKRRAINQRCAAARDYVRSLRVQTSFLG